jgi:hypothetical protein
MTAMEAKRVLVAVPTKLSPLYMTNLGSELACLQFTATTTTTTTILLAKTTTTTILLVLILIPMQQTFLADNLRDLSPSLSNMFPVQGMHELSTLPLVYTHCNPLNGLYLHRGDLAMQPFRGLLAAKMSGHLSAA